MVLHKNSILKYLSTALVAAFGSIFKISKSNIKHIVMVAVFIAFSTTYAAMSKEEYTAVKTLIMQVKTGNHSIAVEAAEALAAYPYIDVFFALSDRLGREMKVKNPDTQLIKALLESMGEVGGPREVQRMHQFGIVLQSNPSFRLILGVIATQVNKSVHAMSIKSDAYVLKKIERPAGTKDEVTALDGTELLDLEERIEKEKNGVNSSRGLGALSTIQTLLQDRENSILTDDAISELKEEKVESILFREEEVNKIINSLARVKSTNILLLGNPRSGKKSVVKRLAQRIALKDYPQHESYKKVLDGAFIVSISIDAAKEGLDSTLAAIRDAQQILKARGILVINGLDQVEDHPMIKDVDKIKNSIKRYPEVIIIGTADSKGFSVKYKDEPSFVRTFEQIAVRDVSNTEALEIVRSKWLNEIEENYNVKFSEDILEQAVKNGRALFPDMGIIDAALNTVQDIAIRTREIDPSENLVEIDGRMLSKLFQERLGIPADPRNGKEFGAYLNNLKTNLNSKVINQHRMISDIVELWGALLSDNIRGVRTLLEMGPTGTGKTKVARDFSSMVFGRDGAFIEIDANSIKDKHQLQSLFGAPPGYISSDKTAGRLMDWLDDPAGGKFGGIIVINEIEKSIPEFWERLMEMMDVGQATGSDGKVRKMNRHMIVFTTNRGTEVMFPQGVEKWSQKEIDEHVKNLDSDKLKSFFMQKLSGKDQTQLKPETMARIDKATVANPITRETALIIAEIEAQKFVSQVAENNKMKLTYDKEILIYIVDSVYKMMNGARPVERAVNQYMSSALTNYFTHTTGNAKSIHFDFEKDIKEARIVIHESGTKMVEILPHVDLFDAMDSQEFRDKLRSIPEELNKRVIGQEEVVKSISESLVSHLSTARDNTRPLALFLIGSTGTGKTETGKAIADVLYGSRDRAEVIALGEVSDERAFAKIMGVDPGMAGSDAERAFEIALRKNPNGGVIVFDEASNMGGNDLHEKDKLFKKFYNILDEGKWTSPTTNTTYDLSKYVLLFTGNDGQELFKVGADDMRLETWKRVKSRANVREILKKSGVPEAFIGRLSDVILMRPLQTSEIHPITEKFVNEILKLYQKRNFKITLDKHFIDMVTRAFYSSKEGGRSIRNVMEHRFKALIAQVQVSEGSLEGKELVVRMEQKFNAKPYEVKDAERSVNIFIDVIQDGKVSKTYNLDVSEYAIKSTPVSKAGALLTAYHEAGHAVANEPKYTREKLAYLTIKGADFYLGYARYDEIEKNPSVNEDYVFHKIVSLVAGSKAQQLAGFKLDTGWGSDLEKSRKLAQHFLLDTGAIPELRGIRYGKDKEPILTKRQAELLADKSNGMIKRAEAKAEEILRAQWPVVRETVRRLMSQSSITGVAFDMIKMQYQRTHDSVSKKPEWLLNEKGFLIPKSREARKPAQPLRCEGIFRKSN